MGNYYTLDTSICCPMNDVCFLRLGGEGGDTATTRRWRPCCLQWGHGGDKRGPPAGGWGSVNGGRGELGAASRDQLQPLVAISAARVGGQQLPTEAGSSFRGGQPPGGHMPTVPAPPCVTYVLPYVTIAMHYIDIWHAMAMLQSCESTGDQQLLHCSNTLPHFNGKGVAVLSQLPHSQISQAARIPMAMLPQLYRLYLACRSRVEHPWFTGLEPYICWSCSCFLCTCLPAS